MILLRALVFLSLLTAPAWAESIDAFNQTCIAHAADLSALPAALDARGLVEIDASTGPQTLLLDTNTGRTWQAPAPEGEKSNLYIGLVFIEEPIAATYCTALAMPGDSAEIAIEALQELYPPHPGSVTEGPAVFYGGKTGWTTTIDGSDYALGVEWAFAGAPDQGPAMLTLLAL